MKGRIRWINTERQKSEPTENKEAKHNPRFRHSDKCRICETYIPEIDKKGREKRECFDCRKLKGEI
jgi:hypothetical protein